MQNFNIIPSEILVRQQSYIFESIGIDDVADMEVLDQLCFTPDIAFTDGYFRLLFYYDHAFGWCLRQQQKLVAFIMITPHRNRANIATIDVSPDFRRKGLGSFLVEYCEKALKQNGYNSVYLQVHTENSGAINLYQKTGYSVVRTLKDYYPSGDAYLMRKLFEKSK